MSAANKLSNHLPIWINNHLHAIATPTPIAYHRLPTPTPSPTATHHCQPLSNPPLSTHNPNNIGNHNRNTASPRKSHFLEPFFFHQRCFIMSLHLVAKLWFYISFNIKKRKKKIYIENETRGNINNLTSNFVWHSSHACFVSLISFVIT